MGAARGVARVRREALSACITCPLCQGLLREATAIAECLHTFCRECIMDKINDDDGDCCPVCSIDLGCDPEEKLRPDHNLQDIRNKLFPIKRRKVGSPRDPTVTLPAKRKQRSLSSLVVDTPRVVIKTGLTGKRSKATRRTPASRATSPGNNGTMKLPTKSESLDQKTEKSSALQSAKVATAANKKQRKTDVKASSKLSLEDRKNVKTTDKQELRKPLNRLVDDASKTKAPRSNPKIHAVKEEQIKKKEGELLIWKEDTENEAVNSATRVRAHSNKSKLKEENNGSSSEPASSKEKMITEDNLKQELLGSESTNTLHGAITTPVWFSLVASPNQKEDTQLPQLSKSYLRIKDRSLQISSVQRYIMNKLDLASEDEVEISCYGEVICPSSTLHGLVDLWLRREPAEPVQASLGAAAKGFVMVLSYRRRRRAPAP
ncbi:E3 ubiquitin protein ligase DRIP2-like [Phragmites australis]|uniref:E3 ubiquitin protein ligase DRIP2-like n=1 Tax=Phragmites australis TaxID=29695 RepID=UPI002D771556|nr:E3 ubiquitin protein ligase DRIP2-like [Phragmites australis]